MKLTVMQPAAIVLQADGVGKVSAEAENGSFTILPRHIDFVTALSAGILSYTVDGTERFAAVDGGILVKEGNTIFVATRRAAVSDALGGLKEIIEKQFAKVESGERAAMSAFKKLEAGFLRNLIELK